MDFAKDWDKGDSALLGAALTGIYADVQSTKKVIEQGGDEKNPILGKKPSGQDLDKIGLLTGAIGAGLASTLSHKWRKPILAAWAGLEHGLADYNNSYDAEKGGGKFQDAVRASLPKAAVGALLGVLATTSLDGLSLGVQEDRRPDGSPSLGPLLRFDMNF